MTEAESGVDSDRLRRFLAASRNRMRTEKISPRRMNFDSAFAGKYRNKPYHERYALSVAYALEREPVHVFPDELLVGMTYQVGTNDPEGYEADPDLRREYDFRYRVNEAVRDAGLDDGLVTGGAPGHIGWRWDLVLELGVEGLMRRIQGLLDQTHDPAAAAFYRAALALWRSVLRWNDRHVAALRASSEDSPRRRFLADLCERVPRHPARTFHEAVQSFHMQHLALMFENPFGGNGPGRLDYFLWPYLRRDLAAAGGKAESTFRTAAELVDELFIRFEERLHPADGWVESIVVGGSHSDGRSSVNPLSYMMVESIIRLKQTHPVVYPRIGRNTPESFIDVCVRYLLQGDNRAQIYNDDACIPAVVHSGASREDAAMYMAGGCMEMSVQGKTCDLNFSRTHNVAKVFELVLTGGIDLVTGRRAAETNGSLLTFRTFEELYSAFEAELQRQYDQIVRGLDITSDCYASYRPCFLLSSLMDDCLERGREQQDGGARYHEYGFSALGIVPVADSMTAIKHAVFDTERVSASALLEALKNDYCGAEDVRALLRSLPKYGSDHAEADAMCNRVMQSVCRISLGTMTRFGGRLKPMIFNFVWTPAISAELGARADGSRAGEYINHGMSPQAFGATKGITAAIKSCTSLDYRCVPGGATSMWDMDSDWINPVLMKSFLTTFVREGGMIFQGNTTSVDELIEADRNPEDHPNVIVRVGGYSAHFATLDPALRKEIIGRYRHGGDGARQA